MPLLSTMKKSFIILFLFLALDLHAQLDSLHNILNSSNGTKSEIYLELAYFHFGDHSDSSLIYLNKAVSNAVTEGNENVYCEAILEKAEVFEKMGIPDSSTFYHEKVIKETHQKDASDKVKARMYFSSGNYFSQKDEYFIALQYLDSSAIYALHDEDSLYFADALNKKGAVNDQMGRRSFALELYLQAMEIYERYDDEQMYGKSINNIAVVYKKSGDFKNALQFYDRSIELAKKQGDEIALAISKVNRGLLLKDMKRFKESFAELHFSLQTFKDEQFTYGIAACLHNLGEAHFAAGDLDSAVYYLDRSQELSRSFEYNSVIIKNLIALAKVWNKKGNYDLSSTLAKQAYDNAKLKHANEDLRFVTQILSDNFEQQGKYSQALAYYKEFKKVEDSIFSKESNDRLNLLRTEYDLKQKDIEIDKLEAENSLQISLAQNRRKTNVIMAVGIATLVVFMVVLFNMYRSQKHLSEKLFSQKALLVDQKNEIESAQNQIVKQNESLINLNKEKDKFLAIVAHDLRSPLNQIRGVLGLIKMEQNQQAKEQLIDIANKSSEVLSERINNILNVEAINAGKINLKIKDIMVTGILDYLNKQIHLVASKKQMKLLVETAENLRCLADENYLIQVLENLCMNAIKYSPKQTEILLSAKSDGKSVLFTIKDNGPGISDNELSQIFLPYSTTSNKPTGDETSTGLGLAIVKKYVEAMEGEVWCESKLNEGSIFYVKLPKAA